MPFDGTPYPALFSPAEKLAAAQAHHDKAAQRWAASARLLLVAKIEHQRRTEALALADAVLLPLLVGE